MEKKKPLKYFSQCFKINRKVTLLLLKIKQPTKQPNGNSMTGLPFMELSWNAQGLAVRLGRGMQGSLWFMAVWWHMRHVCPVLAPLYTGCFGSPPWNKVIWGNYLLCVLHGMASKHQYLLLSGTQFLDPLSHALGKGVPQTLCFLNRLVFRICMTIHMSWMYTLEGV